MNYKKLNFIILAFIVIVIIITGALILAPKVKSTLPPTLSGNNQSAPAPSFAPSPTPMFHLDSSSNLSEESKKLGLPKFDEDYQKLDQSLSSF